MNLVERWRNFKLWWKYPFIRPRSADNDKYCSNFFDYTYLSFFPKGWYKAFGIAFCDDLKKALSNCDADVRRSFRIQDIKEKFGKLQIACNWYTPDVERVLYKYEKLSQKTCINCGHKAKWLSKGYVLPYCNDCMKKVKHELKFVSIFKKGHKHGKNKNSR